MAIFLPVFKLGLLSQCFVSLNEIIPPSLNLFFLALKLFHVHFVRMVLRAQSAVRLSNFRRVKRAIVVNVQQFVRVILPGELNILLYDVCSAHGPLRHEHAY